MDTQPQSEQRMDVGQAQNLDKKQVKWAFNDAEYRRWSENLRSEKSENVAH